LLKYFPLISLLFAALLYFTGNAHFPAVFVASIIQSLILLFLYFIKRLLIKRDIQYLRGIIDQLFSFFAVSITGWSFLALFGQITTIIGRIYSILAVLIFIALSLSLIQQVFITSDLLEPYSNNKGKDDKDDKRN